MNSGLKPDHPTVLPGMPNVQSHPSGSVFRSLAASQTTFLMRLAGS
jgi:hypothetical protein